MNEGLLVEVYYSSIANRNPVEGLERGFDGSSTDRHDMICSIRCSVIKTLSKRLTTSYLSRTKLALFVSCLSACKICYCHCDSMALWDGALERDFEGTGRSGKAFQTHC